MGNCEKNCLQNVTRPNTEILKENIPSGVLKSREKFSFGNNGASISKLSSEDGASKGSLSSLDKQPSYRSSVHNSNRGQTVETGQNIMQFENGCTYEGDWDPVRKRHGFGVYTWSDGSKYSGYWNNNAADGFGKLEHANGEVYEGSWKQDKVEGYGEYKSSEGMVYKGDWKNDLQHGRGVEVWNDISSYEGEYKEGKKDGLGILRFEDGSLYEVGLQGRFQKQPY